MPFDVDVGRKIVRQIAKKVFQRMDHSYARTAKRGGRNLLSKTRLTKKDPKSVLFAERCEGDVFAGWFYQYTAPSGRNMVIAKEATSHLMTLASAGITGYRGGELKINRSPSGVPKAGLGGTGNAIYNKLKDAYEGSLYTVVGGTEHEYAAMGDRKDSGGFVLMTLSPDQDEILGIVRFTTVKKVYETRIRKCSRETADPIRKACNKLLNKPLRKRYLPKGYDITSTFNYHIEDEELSMPLFNGDEDVQGSIVDFLTNVIDDVDIDSARTRTRERTYRPRPDRGGESSSPVDDDDSYDTSGSGSGSASSSSASDSEDHRHRRNGKSHARVRSSGRGRSHHSRNGSRHGKKKRRR